MLHTPSDSPSRVNKLAVITSASGTKLPVRLGYALSHKNVSSNLS